MNRRGQVSQTEWRWVAAWIAVAIVVTSLPYVIGWASASPDRLFGGATFAVEDINSYFAKMREGASGEWLFRIVYTSEPHDGALFFLFHLLLGKFAALAGLPLEAVYHLARLLFGALLMLVLYRFIAALTGSTAVRRIAFWLTVFGGGLGWLLMLAGQPNWLGSPPLDLILPEGFTFLVLYAMPHIALARTLLLLGLLQLWSPPQNLARASALVADRQVQTSQGFQFDWAAGLRAGCLWTTMALIVPFYAVVACAIAIGAFVAESIRSINWQHARRLIVACAVTAIFPVYTVVVFTTNPVFAAWSRQNQIASPHPLHYVVAYGVVTGLALASLRRTWRRRDRTWRYVVGWLVAIPPLLYLPFGLQRRLIESWQIPVSLLAAVTLVRVVLPAVRRSRPVRWLSRLPRYTPRGMRRWALSGLLLLATPSFGLLLLDQSLRAAARSSPMFHDAGEVAALDWLNVRTTYADVVLSAYEPGNYLPARVDARAFVGHGPETIDLTDKLPSVKQFYSAATDDSWRRSFLLEWNIDFVFAGPFERALGAADLRHADYLRLLYDSDGYQVYGVVKDEG